MNKNIEDLYNKLDWQLLKNGFINIYRNKEKLNTDIESLRTNGYKIIIFDANRWNNEVEFHKDISEQLNFPSYYGDNLNAFNDCLINGLMSFTTNIVIVFDNFHLLEDRFGHQFTWSILDIISDNSRMLLLLGKRVLTIVKSDSKIQFEPLGGKIPDEIE